MERNQKMANLIKEISANFLERESNGTTLITVTGAEVSPDLKHATVFISVLPESGENSALDFAKRKRGDLRAYLKKNLSIKIIPFIEVELDKGEKNRQKIDELLRNS